MLSLVLRVGACYLALALIAPMRAGAMSCTIVNNIGVRYGAYNVFSHAPLDSTGEIGVRCSSVVDGDMLSIRLDRGTSGRFTPRAMHNGASHLDYNLYLDAARTVVWGDGTSGTAAYTLHPTNGQLVSVPIFGRVWPRQNVAAGTYSDVVVLTVLY